MTNVVALPKAAFSRNAILDARRGYVSDKAKLVVAAHHRHAERECSDTLEGKAQSCPAISKVVGREHHRKMA
jgi:hypothetical protein